MRFERYTEAETWPLGFGADPQELWVQGWHAGHKALFTVDLADPALPRTLRLARPGIDLEAALMRSPLTGEVVGLQIKLQAGAGEPRAEIWSPHWKALALDVDQQSPKRFNRLQDASHDEQRDLVLSSGNGQPAPYYVGDRTTRTLALLGDTDPGLPPRLLAGKQRVRVDARDGLALSAYLSCPRAATGRPSAHRHRGRQRRWLCSADGVVKTPELFRCAVSFAGVSDLQDLVRHQGYFIEGSADVEAQIGRAWGDRERLRATSPLRQVERIRVPVLLAHGTSDTVMPVSQSRDMARALQRADKPHQYLEFEGGDHHLSRQSHRLAFFHAMTAFLAQQLG